MIKEKISSQEIIDLIASKASVSKRASEEFLKVMIATIEEALLKGEIVKIKNFGTFKLLWNEPRKSVNIQSGEEIILAGYYKVGFTPDVVLKLQVNEPFAHLEPVELDITSTLNDPVEEIDEIPLDPLRIFTEQAFEIRNLISEIQGLSPSKKVNPLSEESISEEAIDGIVQIEQDFTNQIIEKELIPIEEKELKLVEEQEYKQIEEQEPEQEEEKIVVPSDNKDDSPREIQYLKDVVSIPAENVNHEEDFELPVTPYLNNVTLPKKKRKVWILGIVVLILIAGLGTGFFYTYPPVTEYTKVALADCRYSLNKISDNVSFSGIIHTVSGWFTPNAKQETIPETVVIPKETNDFDSINQNQPVDSLQELFDNPRVFNDFIATEKFKSGNRLTIMSKRYYGAKEYWVYIYEANKDQITNPDDIAVGTIIKIPKLDSRLIDPANPRCLKKAIELHDIYIK